MRLSGFRLGRCSARWGRSLLAIAVGVGPLLPSAGCSRTRAAVDFLGQADKSYYEAIATEIQHPTILSEPPPQVALTEEPHTIENQRATQVWDLTLSEAVRLALANNEVFRQNGTFLGGSPVLNGPDQSTATFDPAIQETGVNPGQRGVEAALADFDAQFTTQMTWGRNETLANTPFAGDGDLTGNRLGQSLSDSGNFNAALSKVFASGGQMQLQHGVSYSYNNSPFNFFPSSYTGSASLSYRQPLLAGAGTEYTRIAGPITQNFLGLAPQAGGFFGGGIGGVGQFGGLQTPSVSNGVVIARINNDITLADFERAIRDQLRDVENVYWDLYQAYRQYDTSVTQRNASLETWRVSKVKRDLEADILPAEEAQARDQYFASRALSETARSTIFETETRLRRLLNLPVSDGRIIRPADEPVTAELLPDWYACLGEALGSRVELRRQKWNIKSLQLQRRAADSLTRPRLDFVSGYQVNGFGDRLLGYNEPEGGNFYETLADNKQTGWQLGFEFSVPIGNRTAYSQQRNIDLRLAKAQKVLAVAEQEISQELANAFQTLTRTRATMKSQFARREAAIENVALLEPLLEEGQITLDELLRAQARRGDAESAYFQAVVAYNQAIINLQYRKGTLLAYDNVYLSEGAWRQPAHFDANRRSCERAHARPAPHTHQEPAPFASDFPIGAAGFASDQAAGYEPGGHSVQFATPLVDLSGSSDPDVENAVALPKPNAPIDIIGPNDGGGDDGGRDDDVEPPPAEEPADDADSIDRTKIENEKPDRSRGPLLGPIGRAFRRPDRGTVLPVGYNADPISGRNARSGTNSIYDTTMDW